MTLSDWNADDYLMDFEDIHFSGYLVNAPLIMKVGWVTRYLHDVIFPDAIRAVVNGGELAGLLLTFSIVEYLSGFYARRGDQAEKFKAFMKQYFPSQYLLYIDEIYTHIRNGLVHNLSLMNPSIASTTSFTLEKESDLHLQHKNSKVIFSIHHFIEDTRRAMVMYSYDLIMKSDDNPDLVENFHKRFNKQDGAASMMVKTD